MHHSIKDNDASSNWWFLSCALQLILMNHRGFVYIYIMFIVLDASKYQGWEFSPSFESLLFQHCLLVNDDHCSADLRLMSAKELLTKSLRLQIA